jgi:hypothetical protein
MRGEDATGEASQVRTSRLAEDLRQLGHGSRLASAALHEPVDGIGGGLADLPGEVGVDGGGLRALVSEVLLR